MSDFSNNSFDISDRCFPRYCIGDSDGVEYLFKVGAKLLLLLLGKGRRISLAGRGEPKSFLF
jgi:hypothetical protein